MGNGWHDLAGHHGWATARLLTYCQDLDEAALNATTPGAYGTITETLRHLVDAEMSYLFRLTGAWSERPWPYDEAVGIDVLLERAALLAETLVQFLADDWDDDRLGEAYGDDEVFAVHAGVFLTQAIHHANEHRAHVCSILGAAGYEPPEVSAWAYALATGRMTPRTPADA
jgi:uncharacterized damage-inducible protein DinB